MLPYGVPTPLLLGDGTGAIPNYATRSDPTTGWFGGTTLGAGFTGWSSAGTPRFLLGPSEVRLGSGISVNWSSNADPTLAVADLKLVRDAAAVLALKNGTTPQTLRVYGTTTGPLYAALAHDGTQGTLTTNTGDLWIAPAGALNLYTAGSLRWQVTSAGHLIAGADNSYDLGASGATRPRSVYIAVSLNLGSNPAATGRLRLENNAGGIKFRNAANSADVNVLEVGGTNIVTLGDASKPLALTGSTIAFFAGTGLAVPTYGAPTGTPTRTTFATGSVTLVQLAERVKAMIDDFRTSGFFA